jgi:hypothetical protein
MASVTLEIPDAYRGIVRMGLENTAGTLRQAIRSEMDAEARIPNPSEMDRWQDMLAFLKQAAETLK